MKKIAVLIALTLSSLTGASVFADESVWRQSLAEGNRRMQLRSYEPAQSCFEQAVKESKKDSAATIDEKVLCLESLANVLQLQDITQEALPKYQKSLKMLKKAHGPKSMELLPTLEALARINYLDAQYERAIKYEQEAVAVIHENDRGDSFAFARVARSMGQALAQTHVLGQTEIWYDQALSAAMDVKQIPDETFLEGLLSDYIDVIQKADESRRILSSAVNKELLKDSIDSYSRTKSIDTSQWNKIVSLSVVDPVTGKTTNSPAVGSNSATSNFDKTLDSQDKLISQESVDRAEQAMTAQSKTSSAANAAPASKDLTLARINKQREEFYERMIATDLDSLGANHPSTARDLTGLAYIYISEKRFSEAKPLLERALTIYKSAYGADPQMVKRAETMLAAIDSNSDVLLEDSKSVNEILAGLKPIPVDAQKMDVALRLNFLGLLYYSAGQFDQASKIYAWALPATANACGERSAMTASCLYDYSRVLRSANNVELAKKYEAASVLINDRNAARKAALSMP